VNCREWRDRYRGRKRKERKNKVKKERERERQKGVGERYLFEMGCYIKKPSKIFSDFLLSLSM